MTADDVLREARRRGAEFAVQGDRLRISAPSGTLTDELRAALREHKDELLRMLAGPSLADVVAAVREAVGRISAAYSPGLAAVLQACQPETWGRLERLVEQIDSLAHEGRHEAALTAVACWEACWLEACEVEAAAAVEAP